MAQPEGRAPDRVRDDAYRALESTALESLKLALKFTGGFAATCALLGGGIIALPGPNWNRYWLVVFVVLTLVGGAIVYVVVEVHRLRQHSRLLGQLLGAEKYWDSLLRAEALKTREAEQALRALQTRLDVLMTYRELTNMTGAAAATPVTAPAGENDV